MTKAHYFIAVPLSSEVRQTLSNWTSELSQELHFRSWVHQSDYHITLAFLGDAKVQSLHFIKQNLRELVKDQKPFQLKITGLSTFGNELKPRIFWASVTDNDLLFSLQQNVATVCRNVGFHIEDRPFRPHITLARKWIGEQDFPSKEIKTMVLSEDQLVQWDVKEAVLYQTHLRCTPKYEPLTIFSFQ